jgi:uncharacterized protein (TIGR02996 family)
MSDEAALIRLVRENRNEPLPRLVYADWLDDIGDSHTTPKAAFLRLWCRLLDTPLSDLEGYPVLTAQLEALKTGLSAEWLSDMDGDRFQIQSGPAARERAEAFLSRLFDADDYEIRIPTYLEIGWVVPFIATPLIESGDPPPREKEHKRGGSRKPKRSRTSPESERAHFGSATPLFVERRTGRVDWYRSPPRGAAPQNLLALRRRSG